MTRSEFAQQAAYIAASAAKWSGDVLTLPECREELIPVSSVDKFCEQIREHLDLMERQALAAARQEEGKNNG